MNHIRQRKSIVEAEWSTLVTEWFQTPMNEKGSPAELLSEWNSKILDYVKRRELRFFISDMKFRGFLCEACCTYFSAFQKYSDINGPHRQAPKPLGWTNEAELTWTDYLQTFLFSETFWKGFFVGYSELNDDPFFTQFKIKYAEIIPLYIVRDVEYCINNEILTYNSEKQLVRYSEWTQYDEEDDMAYDPYFD